MSATVIDFAAHRNKTREIRRRAILCLAGVVDEYDINGPELLAILLGITPQLNPTTAVRRFSTVVSQRRILRDLADDPVRAVEIYADAQDGIHWRNAEEQLGHEAQADMDHALDALTRG